MDERRVRAAGAQRVLELLQDRRWHSSAEIEQACNVTCHSRLSDLRGEGCVIEKRRNRGATGREMFSWKLVATGDELRVARATPASLDDPTGDHGRPVGSSSDGRSSDPKGDVTPTGDALGGAPSPAPPRAANPHDFEEHLDGLLEDDAYFEQLQIGAAV